MELGDRDARVLTELCERVGLAPVLKALADLCASEAYAPNTPRAKWEQAFRAVYEAADIVKELCG